MVAPLTLVPPPSARRRLTDRVKRLAAEAGLAVAAVTDAGPFVELEPVLLGHIAAGRVAGLDWFTPERASFSCAPRNLQPTARSILAVGVAYRVPDAGKPDDGVPRGRISRYARGADYHGLLKERMRALHARIEAEVGRPVEARFLVDTARIVDRAVAARAGLGWYGKHSCLIVPGHGSWVLLGELVLDLELEPDAPLERDCGRCVICLDKCPTGAIVGPYTVDAPRCLSFQTIEQRGAIPREIRPLLGDWVYGCDVCQEVCPYTGAAKEPADPAFAPRSLANAYPSLAWLLRMGEAEFRETYRGTPVLRAKRRGLARNAAVALGNVGMEADVPVLAEALAGHDEPLVRGHAAWALGRLGGREARPALERARRLDPDEGVRVEAEVALGEADS
ncbi:MAG: Epoxyqueuosine reductase [uncultured Thermomicrobiales bacterium]|uniref:Epoxyqueuosine reductase n=1 Tax=uncultured Thermomicrobiales bacterium TaxID=1645740 RepID=A0A6J4V184_9BACT|nr:MAG: Epoxyqueuosine reductase [uncultured Thermomicrobiales bacterium]